MNADTDKHERIEPHPDGCSCEACDCECSEHCPVHVPITRDERQRRSEALHPEVLQHAEEYAASVRHYKRPSGHVVAVGLFADSPEGEVFLAHIGLSPYVFQRMHRGMARLAPQMMNGEVNDNRRFWISVDPETGRAARPDAQGITKVVHPAHLETLRKVSK